MADDSGDSVRSRSRSRKKSDQRSMMEGEGHSFVRARDINALPTSENDDSVFDFLDRSPRVLCQNLKILLSHYRIDEDAAPDLIGVERRWFRRLLKQGLQRRMPQLDKVASHFGLRDGHYLWDKDIRRFLGPSPPRPEVLGSWSEKVNWPYAQRLMELLETGQHDYLKGLIDTLHRMVFVDGVAPSRLPVESIPVEPVILGAGQQLEGWESDPSGKPGFVMAEDEERAGRLDKWLEDKDNSIR